MKVAIYTRVSTEEQGAKDRYGLRSQLSDIHKMCRAQRYEIVREYQDMASGAKSDRPAFQAMLNDARHHEFAGIVVAKLDRLARSLVLQLMTTDDMSKIGVEVISVAEPSGHGDPDTERLLRSVTGAFGEYERSRINSRMSGGRRIKAKLGGYCGGAPQYGFQAKEHRLVVDEGQAEIVREVFRLRAQRWSMQEIADKLNESSTTRRGKQWRGKAVWRILRHKSMYHGRYKYANCETKGQHQAIL